MWSVHVAKPISTSKAQPVLPRHNRVLQKWPYISRDNFRHPRRLAFPRLLLSAKLLICPLTLTSTLWPEHILAYLIHKTPYPVIFHLRFLTCFHYPVPLFIFSRIRFSGLQLFLATTQDG